MLLISYIYPHSRLSSTFLIYSLSLYSVCSVELSIIHPKPVLVSSNPTGNPSSGKMNHPTFYTTQLPQPASPPPTEAMALILTSHTKRIFPTRASDKITINLLTNPTGAIDVERGLAYPSYHAIVQAFPRCGDAIIVGPGVKYPLLAVGPTALSPCEAYQSLLGLLANTPKDSRAGVPVRAWF